MIASYPQAAIADYGFWDRARMFFLPMQIDHVAEEYIWIYFKVYRGRRVVLHIERQH